LWRGAAGVAHAEILLQHLHDDRQLLQALGGALPLRERGGPRYVRLIERS